MKQRPTIFHGAGFITFGTNGETGVKITIKKITIKM
jgi:hypothetical protein